jgi:hypothetical protein
MVLLTTLVFFVTSSMVAQTQYIPNGSFEIYRHCPEGLTQNHYLAPEFTYINSKFMLSINFYTGGLDFPPNPSLLDSGWYAPTCSGSPDYFHRCGTNNGEGNAQVPYPYLTITTLRDTLQPCGYPPIGDAYIGLGMRMNNQPDMNLTEFQSYKEYAQAKLLHPIDSGSYYVRFYVSRSKNSHTISQICLFFSSDYIMPLDKYWDGNLAYNATRNPGSYVRVNNENQHNECAVCSNTPLRATQTWQAVEGYFHVPKDSIYNFVSIGNFQTDYELWHDINQNDNLQGVFPYEMVPTYYYIDSLLVAPLPDTSWCSCSVERYDLHLEYKPDTSSGRCCYNYHLYVPSTICPISKFEIIRNNQVLHTELPPDGTYFTIHDDSYTGSFCLDTFSTSQNNFIIRYYTKNIRGEDTLLTACNDTIEINCKCNCSDLPNPPYKRGGDPRFTLEQVFDSTTNGRCCWDLIMNNPKPAWNSASCKYDLSNKYILISSNNFPLDFYTITGREGFTTGFANPLLMYWQADSNFIIKPGEIDTIGRICSNGVMFDSVSVNIIFADSPNLIDTCKKVMQKMDLSCNTPFQDCCDKISVIIDTSYNHDPNPDPNLMTAPCIYPVALSFINTPDSCSYNDTLEVRLHKQNDTTNLYTVRFTQKDVFKNYVYIHWVYVASSDWHDSVVVCADIENIKTNEVCTKCYTFRCYVDMGPYTTEKIPVSEEGIDSIDIVPDYDLSLQNFITVIPNPAENKLEIQFESNNNKSGTISLYNTLSQVVFRQEIMATKGVNKIKIPTTGLLNGTYYLTLRLDNGISTKKIIIIK